MVLLDLFFTSSGLFTQPRDPTNRWPLRVLTLDDFPIQSAATRALASGR
jgi:hypothetical protein